MIYNEIPSIVRWQYLFQIGLVCHVLIGKNLINQLTTTWAVDVAQWLECQLVNLKIGGPEFQSRRVLRLFCYFCPPSYVSLKSPTDFPKICPCAQPGVK